MKKRKRKFKNKSKTPVRKRKKVFSKSVHRHPMKILFKNKASQAKVFFRKMRKEVIPPDNLPWVIEETEAAAPPASIVEAALKPFEQSAEESVLKTAEAPKSLFEIEVKEEMAEISPRIGNHEPSAHILGLQEAIPEKTAIRDDELKDFFDRRSERRPGALLRKFLLWRGVFGNEREYRLLRPARPRLIEAVLDELLIINLAQIGFAFIRWAFNIYFSVFVWATHSLLLIFRKKDIVGSDLRAEKQLAGRRSLPSLPMPARKAVPVPVLRREPVAWRASFRFFSFAPPLRFERALATFILLAFVFILPLRIVSTYREVKNTKSVLMERSVRAFEALEQSWSQVGNLEAAAAAFEDASRGFDAVLSQIEETHQLLQAAAALLPEGEELEAGKSLLMAGSLVSASAQVLSGRLATLNDVTLPPSDRVHQLGESLRTALPLLENAREKMDSISLTVIPGEFRSSALGAMRLLDQVIDGVESSEMAAGVLEYILGRSEPKRYLVVFQNNTELRPSGGFIGSFAELSLREGEVTGLWMPGGGSYELQGSLRATLIPPEPMQLIAERWEFQDANWFPDFPATARKLMWFYEKSGGPTVDGVIALTTSVIEKLLLVTGPIEMPEYGKVISADNFWLETQKAVELEYDRKENKPKQFLADLAPKLIERLKSHDPKTFFALAKALHDTISEKHFQVYLRDNLMQEKVTHLGWGGELKATSGDTLFVVNTNIAGGKTDAVISEHIKHTAQIDEGGRVRVELLVERTHEGTKGELFRGVRNVDYVRVYVPDGSTLIEASGFSPPDQTLFKSVDEKAVPDLELAAIDAASVTDPISGTTISHEFGRTVFGNWIMVDPGQSATYRLVYELPTRVTFREAEVGFFEKLGLREVPAPQASYSLLLLKQAGTKRTTVEHKVILPPTWKSIWQYPGSAALSLPVERDMFFGTVAIPAP